PENANIVVRIAGKRLILQIKRNRKLLPPTFTVTRHLANGSLITETPSLTLNHCLYHGRVAGEHDSLVVLSTCEGLRCALSIRTSAPDKRCHFLHPQTREPWLLQFLYRTTLHMNSTWRKNMYQKKMPGSDAGAAHPREWPRSRNLKRSSAWRAAKHVELVLVADHAEFMKMGHDYWRTALRMMEIANHVDKVQRPPLLHEIIKTSPCSMSPEADRLRARPRAAVVLKLRQRRISWALSGDTIKRLVGGARFTGVTVGMAPLMGMCSREQNGIKLHDHTESVLAVASTVAHEMGHNFGLNHDGDARQCPCQHSAQQGGCIMAPATGFPYPRVFSSCSVRALRASLLEGGAPCVFNAPDVTALYGGGRCGNGYVEEGESCDCGEPQQPLPYIFAHVLCPSHGGNCFHRDGCARVAFAGLLLESDALLPVVGVTWARPVRHIGWQPKVRSRDVIDKFAPVSVRGSGLNWVPLDVEEHQWRCFLKWTPQPPVFMRILFLARPKSVHGPAWPRRIRVHLWNRHALCGKLQCGGGAEAPVVGGGAVTIRTTVPTRGGRSVLCKGVHVYSDIPDPGLALAGTTCGPRKICHNRECVNVSTLGFEACSSKCNAHGVCNSKGNCHCDPGWDPPHCDQPGNGGSVDSGPVPPA
uniref:ADAM metallopeptidase domain 12 n=1 Tax=Petromyzon marinus TaxID=7757 RepID=S4RQY6_PETMA